MDSRTLNLIVTSAIALILIGLLVFLAIKQIVVPEYLQSMIMVIIGFYFGSNDAINQQIRGG